MVVKKGYTKNNDGVFRTMESNQKMKTHFPPCKLKSGGHSKLKSLKQVA